MGVFQRIFRVGQAEVHAAIDKLEDPIRLTEQGIRDLKKDLSNAMTSLAEVKGQGIRLRKQASDSKKAAEDYERKAMALLQRAQKDQIDAAEADRLAGEALARKEENVNRSATLSENARKQEEMAAQLQTQVDKLKSSIAGYENDLVTLRAPGPDSRGDKENQQATGESGLQRHACHARTHEGAGGRGRVPLRGLRRSGGRIQERGRGDRLRASGKESWRGQAGRTQEQDGNSGVSAALRGTGIR